jgi:hypothetical protein
MAAVTVDRLAANRETGNRLGGRGSADAYTQAVRGARRMFHLKANMKVAENHYRDATCEGPTRSRQPSSG